MIMKIKSLLIENFKGIRRFELSPNAEVTKIKAKNGVGKTTICDSFLWLLFGTNSAGDSKFEVRTNGAPLEIEPTVTAILGIDGKDVELKKVLASKFTKETGEFKETKTECYINGVKKGPREYEAFISEVVSTDKFKLLTNPRYFTEDISWQERRQILFDVAGTLTETDIIGLHPEYSDLTEKLEKYGSIDEYKKYLKGEAKSLSEQTNAIPVRIDETFRSIDTTIISYEAEQDRLLESERALQEARIQLREVENGNGADKFVALKAQTESALALLDKQNTKHRQEQLDKAAEERNEELRLIAEESNAVNAEIQTKQREITALVSECAAYDVKREQQATRYREIAARTFEDTCPTCHRPYPESEISAARDEFLSRNSKEIAECTALGTQYREELNKRYILRDNLTKEIDVLADKLNECVIRRNVTENKTTEVRDMSEYAEKSAELTKTIEDYEKSIETCRASADEDIRKIKANITLLEVDVSGAKQRVSQALANKAANNRIEELKAEQRRLAQLKADNSRMTDLVKEFIRTKTSLIEENINKKFSLARFKLFSQNVTNDDINECCEVIAYNSPSYKNLSNGQKSMTGIDIINTLSKHYGIAAPLFFDNLDALDSENQRKVFDTASGEIQKITLTVSDDTELTIEGDKE